MNMSIVSISEAARLTRQSRRTLQRHIKDGKLSATQKINGLPGIQISELLRVYGEIYQETPSESNNSSPVVEATVTTERNIDLELENARLKAELAATKNHVESLEKTVERLFNQNTALISYTKPDDQDKPEPKKSLLKRIFG